MTMHRRILFLVLSLIGVAPVVRAQIVRGGSTVSATAADTLSPFDLGRRAQRDFELFRRLHLPYQATGRSPSQCDERVGRFCYWYDERSPAAPPEPGEISAKRNVLIALLDSLGHVAPDERWIVAQRVRYLVEAGRGRDALTAARECKVGGWYCEIMIGFSHHMLGEYKAADSVYEGAIAKMLERDRCVWRDLGDLIDDDTRQSYRRLPCGSKERIAYENRVWFLAKVLYSTEGNDSRTEWYARMTYVEMMRDAAGVYQFGFDDDERELLLRFGWPRAWARGRGDPRTGEINTVGHEPTPAYRFIPPGYVLNNPTISDSTDWAVQLPPVVGRYAPPYAKTLKPLVHQKAMFRRGDSALVVMAYDARNMPELDSTGITAALVVAPVTGTQAFRTIHKQAPRKDVITAKAPWAPLIMSAEVWSPDRSAVRRARYGMAPPFAVGTRVTLSDLLFYEPYGDFPTTVEEVAPHALTTEKVHAGEKLGVYWEAYGTELAGEPMKVSLTVVREVEESGFLRRQAKTLRVVTEATPVSITVQDMSARGSSTSPRALQLDISTLSKGAYVVQLEIEVAGQYIVRADHRIEITGR